MQPICSTEQALAWVNRLTDDLGRGVEEAVMGAVAGLYRLGIKTHASCEGHTNRSLPYPWIDIHPQSRGELEELLAEYPLPGWTIFPGDPDTISGLRAHRLLPEILIGPDTDLGAITYALLPSADSISLMQENHVKLRQSLLQGLEGYQAQIYAWGKNLLALSGPEDR